MVKNVALILFATLLLTPGASHSQENKDSSRLTYQEDESSSDSDRIMYGEICTVDSCWYCAYTLDGYDEGEESGVMHIIDCM